MRVNGIEADTARGDVAAAPADSRAEAREIRKVTLAGSIGTFIEYFDLAIYGVFAAVLAREFFPSSDETANLLNSFAVFAVAFLARPLGGMLWGPLGDRIGRRRTLATIIVVMAASTGAVGLLPNYAMVGIWAPLGLILLRVVQGLSAGGEISGAAVYVGEHARRDRRCYQTSFLMIAISAGLLLALVVGTIIVTTTPRAALDAWGWRIPFLLAFPMGAIGIFLRLRLEETPAFRKIEEAGATSKTPLRQVLGTSAGWSGVGRAVLVALPCMVSGFGLLTFMPTFLQRNIGFSTVQALGAISIAMCFVLVAHPLGGRLSDTIGRKRTLFLVCLFEIVTALPGFNLIHSGSVLLAAVGLILIGVPYGLATGSQFAPMLESFPTAQRFTGIAIATGLTTAFIAGPTPYVSTWLIGATGSTYAPAWLIMLVPVPALIGALLMRETYHKAIAA